MPTIDPTADAAKAPRQFTAALLHYIDCDWLFVCFTLLCIHFGGHGTALHPKRAVWMMMMMMMAPLRLDGVKGGLY